MPHEVPLIKTKFIVGGDTDIIHEGCLSEQKSGKFAKVSSFRFMF